MTARPRRAFALPVAAALLLLLPAGAAAASKTLRVEIHDENDESLVVTVGGWVATLVKALAPETISCDGDTDRELVAVLRRLERGGEGSSAEGRDGDDRVRGERRGGRLFLTVESDDDDEDVDIDVPWAVGRCMLGHDIALRDLLGGDGGGLEVHVRDHGSRIHVEIQ
jgi:hypothetical protein